MAQALTSATFHEDTRSVCIGSGRFLRAVLVPALHSIGSRVVVMQTRGTSFSSSCRASQGVYEVDTVERDGGIHTASVTVEAVGSLGDASNRSEFLALPSKLPKLQFIGVGVTESGISADSQAIRDLSEFLYRCSQAIPKNMLSVLNTDNLPANGDAIKQCVIAATWPGQPTANAWDIFVNYLNTQVVFHNTMVDCITAHRASNTLVPSTEPMPSKALVIEDLTGVLTPHLPKLTKHPGVVVRTVPGQLEQDHMIKLRVANAIHTATVYLLALTRVKNTVSLLQYPVVRQYLDLLFAKDIRPSLVQQGVKEQDAQTAFDEWTTRVSHPHFGLDTFWVAQNAMLKYGVRLFSSVAALTSASTTYRPSVYMAFSTAVLLRYLTPTQEESRRPSTVSSTPVFVGQMDALQDRKPRFSISDKTWTYGNDLTANVSTGKYEFMDGTTGAVAKLLRRASTHVLSASKSSSATHVKPATASASSELAVTVGVAIASALSTVDGFNLSNSVHAEFASEVATLYQRLVESKPSTGCSAMDVLADVMRNADTSEYIGTREELAVFVRETVATVPVIDVHTHLFPPSHGKLMLWGVNELLTYHYLVAEYMMTAPMEIEEFNTLPKATQASLIWQHLFIDRAPISEACRGVVTTLTALGLGELVKKRDLAAIQNWFEQQDPEEYVDTVFRLSGLKYAVMTNIPFEPEEARHWLGDPASGTPPAKWSRTYFRSALRVDQVLLGDWKSMGPALDVFQLPHTLEGCRQYLIKWIEIMEPEYFMSSVPVTFRFPDSESNGDAAPSDKPSGADLLLKVLLPLAQEKNLPIALKFDSVRPINARLGVAGDGVKPTDVDILIKLCRGFPKVKFLATYLSRVNQHEVTVTANKFRNLHLYGCWWYCNNPSIIDEMTRQRIEILGTAFTSQHSDARVLDQLIYKWIHSREVIGDILVDMYDKMAVAGWTVSKDDLRRDIGRLFGASYEEYMSKTP